MLYDLSFLAQATSPTLHVVLVLVSAQALNKEEVEEDELEAEQAAGIDDMEAFIEGDDEEDEEEEEEVSRHTAAAALASNNLVNMAVLHHARYAELHVALTDEWCS